MIVSIISVLLSFLSIGFFIALALVGFLQLAHWANVYSLERRVLKLEKKCVCSFEEYVHEHMEDTDFIDSKKNKENNEK